MPIVFVHGVNNRLSDSDYKVKREKTQKNLSSFILPLINETGLDRVRFPYWGDHGVKFGWNNASVPRTNAILDLMGLEKISGGYEALGFDDDSVDLFAAEVMGKYPPAAGAINLPEIACQHGARQAVGVLFDAAGIASRTAEYSEELAEAYKKIQSYLESSPSPDWAMKADSNDTFLRGLSAQLRNLGKQSGETKEALGGLSNFSKRLREGLSRLIAAPGADLTKMATPLRPKAHASAARFLGDIFVYLARRGEPDAPGPIPQLVAQSFDEAKEVGGQLVVVAHSLGGVISYDILTRFRPDIQVDFLITIGSQVAVFEEMSLYREEPAQQVAAPAKLAKPDNVTHWINVFDTNDVFSFLAGGVYSGVKDYRYVTGFGGVGAHGGYFERLTFYEGLARRMKESLP